MQNTSWELRGDAESTEGLMLKVQFAHLALHKVRGLEEDF